MVFSWDGAGEVGNGLFPRFLKLAEEHDAHMTFFLSGLYLLPEAKKRLYRPPNNSVSASDIGYLTDEHIKETLKYVREAWLGGHEIGTHFEEWNGGIYMDAVEETLKTVADKKDVRLVSFRQFVDWLDVQDPAVLQKLQSLGVGQAPAGGWGGRAKAS